jgi:ABC-2 type transport system permease protein
VKVIYALWLRELKRFARSRIQIIVSLGQPIMYFLALGHGLSPVFRRSGAGDYLQIVGSGVIAMAVLFASMSSGEQLIWDREFGYLKAMWVAPISRMQIIVGRTCGVATAAVAQGILAGAGCMLAGLHIVSFAAIPLALLFLLLIALLFTALSITIASSFTRMQTFGIVQQLLLMPIFLLSGALFPLEGLPRVLAVATRIDPLTYGVDGLRDALTARSHFGALMDWLVISIILVCIMSLGLSRFRASNDRS